ncbi:hypothetical protein K438DRAFT_2021357, partial [Mycena galopus ATCC 62051]
MVSVQESVPCFWAPKQRWHPTLAPRSWVSSSTPTAPFHLTLCGHGRASHAPRIRRRRPLPHLSASPLPRAWRPRHIHRPAHGQAPQQTLATPDILRTRRAWRQCGRGRGWWMRWWWWMCWRRRSAIRRIWCLRARMRLLTGVPCRRSHPHCRT